MLASQKEIDTPRTDKTPLPGDVKKRGENSRETVAHLAQLLHLLLQIAVLDRQLRVLVDHFAQLALLCAKNKSNARVTRIITNLGVHCETEREKSVWF